MLAALAAQTYQYVCAVNSISLLVVTSFPKHEHFAGLRHRHTD